MAVKVQGISEEVKDNLFEKFVEVSKTYSDMWSYQHSIALEEAKKECWNELMKYTRPIKESLTCNYPKAFMYIYKAWTGIIFRAKCNGLPCSEFMHPFEILDYALKLSPNQIYEYFDGTKNYSSIKKSAKTLRANSMIKREQKDMSIMMDMSIIASVKDRTESQ